MWRSGLASLALVMATVDLYPGMPSLPTLPQLRIPLNDLALAWGRPGDVFAQAVFPAVVNHRLLATAEREAGAPTAEEILAAVAIP